MNKYLITGIVGSCLWVSLFSKAQTQPPNCTAMSLSEVNESVSTFQQGNVIVIGRVPNHRYVVVVPGKSNKLLNTVRNYIADAFMAHHRLGTYVYAGGFSRRQDAECVSLFLRSQGLDARVVYFH